MACFNRPQILLGAFLNTSFQSLLPKQLLLHCCITYDEKPKKQKNNESFYME